MTSLLFENFLVWYARNFPVRRGKLRVVESLWRAAANSGSPYRTAILKHGGFRVPCDLRQMLQRQFYFFGTYFLEERLLRCWESRAKGARIVLDVGANGGIYSLAALSVQADATVHAFEPTPEIAARLRVVANENGLDHLIVHELAVLDRDGEAVLTRFRGEQGTNDGMNFVSSKPGDGAAELVRTVCLDRFCEEHAIERIDLLKIDIQGQEDKALMGARRLLNEGRVQTVFMELNWATERGVTCPATESIRLLDAAGYSFSTPNGGTGRRPGPWLHTLSDIIAQAPASEIRS